MTWPIWHRGSKSILFQMMACCLTVPSHHLKQCRLIFNYTLDNLEFESKLKKDLNENEENAFENVICKCRQFCSGLTMLTLNVRGSSYLGLTRSISWLLMPWLLTLPGHQQPWYWLYRMCRSFFYLRKDFKYLCQINVEEWHKMQIYVYVPSEKFSM